GWFLNDARHDRIEASNPVIRDFSSAPEIAFLDRFFFLPPLLLAVAMYLIGGMQWLVWGFCVPTVTLAHATFAINTVNHLIEARRQSRSESRRAIMGRASRDSRPGRRGYDAVPEQHHRVRDTQGNRSVSA